QWWPAQNMGWNTNFFGSVSSQQTIGTCYDNSFNALNFDIYGPWVYSEPNGTQHVLQAYVTDQPEVAPTCITPDPYPSPASGTTQDGYGWKISATWQNYVTLISPSGWTYFPPQLLGPSPYIKDADGNQVNFGYPGGLPTITDTLGVNEVILPHGLGSYQYGYPD